MQLRAVHVMTKDAWNHCDQSMVPCSVACCSGVIASMHLGKIAKAIVLFAASPDMVRMLAAQHGLNAHVMLAIEQACKLVADTAGCPEITLICYDYHHASFIWNNLEYTTRGSFEGVVTQKQVPTMYNVSVSDSKQSDSKQDADEESDGNEEPEETYTKDETLRLALYAAAKMNRADHLHDFRVGKCSQGVLVTLEYRVFLPNKEVGRRVLKV